MCPARDLYRYNTCRQRRLEEGLGHQQRVLGSHMPPWHMVIATTHSTFLPCRTAVQTRPGEGGGGDGMVMCPAPVLTWPEAPGSETLWLTCQGVAGSPALDSGVTGHR